MYAPKKETETELYLSFLDLLNSNNNKEFFFTYFNTENTKSTSMLDKLTSFFQFNINKLYSMNIICLALINTINILSISFTGIWWTYLKVCIFIVIKNWRIQKLHTLHLIYKCTISWS